MASPEPTPGFERVPAPWTDEQVANANAWQTAGHVHPFTCGQRDDHAGQGVLTATPTGWVCPECDYTQGTHRCPGSTPITPTASSASTPSTLGWCRTSSALSETPGPRSSVSGPGPAHGSTPVNNRHHARHTE